MSRCMATKKVTTARLFALGCGCGNSKSVSVSDSSDVRSGSTITPRRPRNLSSADTLTATLTSASTSSPWDDDDGDKFDSTASTPSFSGLLRQLSELERSVNSWGSGIKEKERKDKKPIRGHKRSLSESGGRVMEESVPVVKESEDPLGDFRRSMLQMIVEKEIVRGEELKELLRRFLSLNSPRHHHLILRAFAEIWEEVFEEYENISTPDLLASVTAPPRVCHGYPSPRLF